jgi:hypothetical protein
MKSRTDQIIHGPHPDNQVPGPVSSDKGHSTSELPDKGHQPQGMGRSNKLLPRHKGPYQVIRKRQSIYIIEDQVKGKQIKTHVHKLRPFIFSPTQVNPLDLAQQNEQEFVVDVIVATIIEDPPWSFWFDGLVTMKARKAGNHTRLSCMWTSFI